MDIREYLFEKDPYEGIDVIGHEYDLHPFNTPHSVLDLVSRLRPSLVIEVGSWKGASAVCMADQMHDQKIDGHIICIDTWLGAEEMWTKPLRDDGRRYTGLKLEHGYPRMYLDFMKNIIISGHRSRITPFPNTSLIASRVLKTLGVKADFIYIDGSHDYEDVKADLAAYWPLLSDTGVMIGDDYNEVWPVKDALHEFSIQVERSFEVHADNGWAIQKMAGAPNLLS